jgi:hypothetical protein
MNELTAPAHPASRRWLWAVLFGLGALGLALLWASSRQPQYRGRPVMTWAAELSDPDPAVSAAARRAILALGPRAIPTLRRVLGKGDPLLARMLVNLQGRWPGNPTGRLLGRLQPYSASLARGDALRALGVLGPVAAPAVADIARLAGGVAGRFDGPAEQSVAAATLGALGPVALPALTNALAATRDPDRRVHLIAALGRLGPAAAPALPDVLAAVDGLDSQPGDRSGVAFVRSVGPEAAPVLLARLAAVASESNLSPATLRVLGLAVAEDIAFRRRVLDAFSGQPSRVQGLVAPVLVDARIEPRRVAITLGRALATTNETARPTIEACLRDLAPAGALAEWFASEPEAVRRRVEALGPGPGRR